MVKLDSRLISLFHRLMVFSPGRWSEAGEKADGGEWSKKKKTPSHSEPEARRSRAAGGGRGGGGGGAPGKVDEHRSLFYYGSAFTRKIWRLNCICAQLHHCVQSGSCWFFGFFFFSPKWRKTWDGSSPPLIPLDTRGDYNGPPAGLAPCQQGGWGCVASGCFYTSAEREIQK